MKPGLAYILLCLLLACPLDLHSQESADIDGMEAQLRDSSTTQEDRLFLLDELSWAYQNSDFRKSVDYALEGLALAKKLGDETTEGYIYLGLGTAHHLNKDMGSAMLFYDKAEALAVKLDDTDLMFMVNNAYGNYYSDLAQFDSALEYYLTNLRLARLTGEENTECYSLANIGNIYQLMRNYGKAEEYLLEAKALAERIDYKNALATILVNLDEIYIEQGYPEQGLDYSKQAADLYHEIGFYPEEIQALLGVAQSCLHARDYPAALDYAARALRQAEEIGYPQQIALCHRMFSFIYYDMGEPRTAREHGLKAYALADSVDYHNIELLERLVEIHMDLREIPAAKGYFSDYKNLTARYNDQEMQRTLTEMEVKYETEKKEAHIARLSQERRLYFTLMIVGAAGVVLLIVILLLFHRYQHLKRIRVQEQVEKLEQEKQLVAAESLLDGENHERERLSRELHDGLGGLLTMIRLDLAQIRNTISAESKRLDDTIGLMDKSITEMRRLAHNLMPESLARFGLKPVLEDFCSGSESVGFHFFGEERRLDEKTEVNVYRIACELINNALKHSDAAEINVQLIQSADKLSLTVSDNGKGLGDSEAKEGLATVRSRVELLRAVMNIYSQPGTGTEITVELEY